MKASKANGLVHVIYVFILLSAPASAGWFGGDKSPRFTVTDAAYAKGAVDRERPRLDGMERVSELHLSSDHSILLFEITQSRLSGFLDQYEHGLLNLAKDGQRYQAAYDRQTGFFAYQSISGGHLDQGAAIQTSQGVDATDSLVLLQVKDASILAFLDTLIDHFDGLVQYGAKPSDCGLGEPLKQQLPLDRVGAALPPDAVLFGRSLKPAEGCQQIWQSVQFAIDSILELASPIRPAQDSGMSVGCLEYYQGCGGRAEPSIAPAFAQSKLGSVSVELAAKLPVLASTGRFRPINYDLATASPSFELDAKDQALQVKQRQEYVGSTNFKTIYRPRPTLWNAEEGLKQLRSDKLKPYQRQPE